ncbi:GNAT family N-acetyltransferase [Bradyrhizobium uaiense]|uniref:GNAT family N-acetyltransferase n=1 Tax=Bradyrhizobium uaiense TaxID=2594946 RepID=A0A6P1BD45_9BRAD|nr:GNAT family N-acetyltransferase [Bradyrhizobium uaiense]NEU96203.1 GNAT family N-acetyltransferase [Bradyrhizobium uaiense]
MKVVRFREIDRSAWDGLALQSPQAWLTHRSSWIEIEQRFFVSTNLSFALEEGSQLVGIQPLFINEGAGMPLGERLLHSGIHRHTGLALAPDIDAGVARAARQAAMQEIFAIADLYDVDRIQLNCHNLAPAHRHPQREAVPFWVSEFGFQLGIAFGPSGMLPCPGSSTLNADQLVDLAPTVEELFAGLDNTCRTAVRKAQKSNLQFEISSDVSYLDTYMDIARASATRTGEVLPDIEYYRSIFRAFAAEGGARVALVRQDGNAIAGLILLTDKKAASFLAGVSLPDAMKLRPNNFLHWNAIRWAKQAGLEVYRFGPSFPEVPRDWPIAMVSHFKTIFGSRSVPVIQGSLFRRPELYTSNILAASNRLNEIASRPADARSAGQAGGAFIVHHLHTFGFRSASSMQAGEPVVLYRPSQADLATARDVLAGDGCVIAVLPSAQFAREFGVDTQARSIFSPSVLRAAFAGSKPWSRLRTLHSHMCFVADGDSTTIVENARLEPIWLHRKMGDRGSVIFIGTDLASDLMQYRQGDPAAASNRPTEPMWGIAGERPNYLFEGQLAGESLRERPADWWCEALADALVRLSGISRLPILPNGAVGAVVITGDDDQAALSCYAQQQEALGSLPVTYFLHPLTKHTQETLRQLKAGRKVELGIHPDALDRPDRYAELFSEQARWFERLTGARARSVRNHGFLNDGYWGHASVWNTCGIRGSSNLPGLDGSIINGSLLPARIVLDGKLTEHWSVLTAIGDGIVFINDWDDRQSADCVLGLADRIRQSGVPGVIVINLHPENIGKTRGMHQALIKLVEYGFIPWTMTECFDWFETGVHRSGPADTSGAKRPSVAEKVRSLLGIN